MFGFASTTLSFASVLLAFSQRSRTEKMRSEAAKKRRCDTCRAEGARMRCSKCNELFFCNRTCLRRTWHVHKRLCDGPRKWVAVEMAIERAIVTLGNVEAVPESAKCYICLENGDLRRECACRGDAGCVHVKCLVELIARNPQKENHFCPLCHQVYSGRLMIGLVRMMWQRARDTDRAKCFIAISQVLSIELQRSGEPEATSSLRGDTPGSIVIDRVSHAESHLQAGRFHEAI